MLFFKLDASGKVVQVSSNYPRNEYGQWLSRGQLDTFARAEDIAQQATAVTGKLHIATDSGPSVSPRYDVQLAPAIGDPVSYGFNGDYYPDGEIVHLTPGSLRVAKTSTGSTYYRRKNSGNWTKQGGTWSMVKGHHDERNPHF